METAKISSGRGAGGLSNSPVSVNWELWQGQTNGLRLIPGYVAAQVGAALVERQETAIPQVRQVKASIGNMCHRAWGEIIHLSGRDQAAKFAFCQARAAYTPGLYRPVSRDQPTTGSQAVFRKSLRVVFDRRDTFLKIRVSTVI